MINGRITIFRLIDQTRMKLERALGLPVEVGDGWLPHIANMLVMIDLNGIPPLIYHGIGKSETGHLRVQTTLLRSDDRIQRQIDLNGIVTTAIRQCRYTCELCGAEQTSTGPSVFPAPVTGSEIPILLCSYCLLFRVEQDPSGRWVNPPPSYMSRLCLIGATGGHL